MERVCPRCAASVDSHVFHCQKCGARVTAGLHVEGIRTAGKRLSEGPPSLPASTRAQASTALVRAWVQPSKSQRDGALRARKELAAPAGTRFTLRVLTGVRACRRPVAVRRDEDVSRGQRRERLLHHRAPPSHSASCLCRRRSVVAARCAARFRSTARCRSVALDI